MKHDSSSDRPPLSRRSLSLLLGGILLASTAPVSAGITSYGAFKGTHFEQLAAGTPTATSGESHGAYFFVKSAAEEEILLASVQPAGALTPQLLFPNSEDPTLSEADASFASLSALNAAVPDGAIAFSLFDGDFTQLSASLTLSGGAFPAATGLSNFAESQKIDAKQDFTLQWTVPAGVTAQDYVQVQVENSDGTLLATAFPWASGALPATTTSFTIPANTLTGTDLDAQLVFIHVTARNTTAIPNATGLSGYFVSTRIPLKLTTGGGGGGDTTAPSLVSSSPVTMATGVPTNTAVVLTFSEPMQPVQTVNWFNVPNSAAINYAWSGDGRTLTCTLPGGFPASTQVIWGLDQDSFKDVAGNKLAAGMIGGLFTTAAGGGGGTPCEDGFSQRSNFFFVSKEVSHVQTSAAAPAPGGDPVAMFGSFFTPTGGVNVSAASVRLPGGEVRNLTGVLGRYFLSVPAASESALNTAFPAGNYTASVTVGGSSGSLTLPMVAAPPVPQCANFAAAQAVDPAAAFTLQWNAFTGATGNDRLEISIQDSQGNTVFQAPDECAQPPRLLAATATSVTLSAGLLQAGKTYDVELRFLKVGSVASSAAPAFEGTSGFSQVTRFTLKTTGGTSDSVVIKAFRLPADNRFEVDVEAGASQTVFLEAWVNFTTWEQVNGTVTGPLGLATLKDQRSQVPDAQVFRVRTQ
jgi:hypothetical protein